MTTSTSKTSKDMPSVFARFVPQAYPYAYLARFHVGRLVGGIPTEKNVAEGWLRSKLGDKDNLIREAVAKTMVERGVDAEEATALVDADKHLNGFKRGEEDGHKAELYIEGRQLKAAIKEAANIRWPKERWGPSRKGTLSFFAEHVFVKENELWLGVTEPSGIAQRFVHTWRGSGIQQEEYVDGAQFEATILTDNPFTPQQIGLLWVTGEQQGIGATRSQGFGRYNVIGWEEIDQSRTKAKRA